MTALAWLVPAAISLGALGLAAFLWTLKSHQYEDLQGAGWRALHDEPLDRCEAIRPAPFDEDTSRRVVPQQERSVWIR